MRRLLVAVFVLLLLVPASNVQAVEYHPTWHKTRVQIYAPTHEGYRYRFNRVIRRWNQNNQINLVRVYQPCTYCITVKHVNNDKPWQGLATLTFNTYNEIETCTVRLQQRVAKRYGAWALAAHEIGHCLGLPHTTYRPSVMAPTNIALRASDRDIRFLNNWYSP